MDLRQLNSLLAVADHHSFSAAARALFTVQSNVSTHLQRLERELGAVLIDRGRVQLTEEGELVAARARRILAELDAIPGELAAARGDVAGEVRIGVIGTTARWLIPLFLPALRISHPAIRVVVVEASTTSLLPRVADGHLQLAVVNLPDGSTDLDIDLLFDEDLLLLAPSSHPLAALPVVSVRDLADHEILLPPIGTALRDELDDQARRSGVRLRALAEIDGGRLMASLALEGFGAAVVPATAVPDWLKGDFVLVPMTGLSPRRVGLVQRRRTSLSPAARAVVAELHAVVRMRAVSQTGVHVSNERTAGPCADR